MFKYSKKVALFVSLILMTSLLFSQESEKIINVKYISDEITIDGNLDEEIWNLADSAENFWQFFPTDSIMANQKTTIKIVYDDNTLYVGIRAEVPNDDYVISSLRRDYSARNNDNVTLLFDTFNDGTNAFMFGINPYGVQREALISGGGSTTSGFNPNWDVKWQSESVMHKNYYSAEIAIPFSSVKFKEGETKWRFQCYRWDFQSNERSAWASIPQTQLMINLAFMGELHFEKPLEKSKTPIAIIPYINALSQKNYETGNSDSKLKFGGDAKIAIGNSMNLDITVNPDFSTVEVDNIFTNLTRFEISLPEKRQFFIDNGDLFGDFGSNRDANPFFSRRIGIAKDSTGNLIENRILGGVRLSGKINQDWRIGFLNIQTDEDKSNEIASNNNMMLAVQKKVFSRSNIGFFMINRQTFKNYDFLEETDKYNRVVGVDFNLASEDNVWTGKFYLHKSFQPDDSKGNFSSQAFLSYNTRHWRLATDFVYVDEEFRSDLGFIPRTDVFKSGNSISRIFYPKKGKINSYNFRFLSLIYWKPNLNFKKTDHDFRFSWNTEFKSQSVFEIRYNNRYIFLTNDFDPTGKEDAVPLPANTDYNFNQVFAEFQSNRANVLSFNANTTVGQFFNGNIFSLGGGMSLRLQPKALLSLDVSYNQIRFPNPYSDADLWLISPKIDITFSKSLFWSTLIQYSNQQDNFGINSRLQWRFAPLSDLYLVYNDNYFTTQFAPRFRSINLKLSYWLNIP